ncbi:radical SAM protein [bacterium]|nr:radical SAM protein [candidate division CSSED10-310 bacterium]
MKYLDYMRFAPRLLCKRGADPLYFVFFITERCLARCRHCLLGAGPRRRDELRLDEIAAVSRSMGPMLFLLLTGGDPFLRRDLPDIVELFYVNNRVRNLGMPTNGSLPDQVERAVREVLTRCPKLDYAVDISIDGIGAEHDHLRNCPGLFERAVETYRRLETVRSQYDNFNLNVAVTVSAYNQDRLGELYDYLREELGVQTINHLLVRGNPREPAAAQVDPDRYHRFSRLLERDMLVRQLTGYHNFPFSDFVNAMKHVRQRIIERIARGGRSPLPCYAAVLSAVLYANGDLYPCELLDRPLGNVREAGYDFNALWRGPAAREAADWIRRTRCQCTYECFLTNSILFSPRAIPAVLTEVVKLKWMRLLLSGTADDPAFTKGWDDV